MYNQIQNVNNENQQNELTFYSSTFQTVLLASVTLDVLLATLLPCWPPLQTCFLLFMGLLVSRSSPIKKPWWCPCIILDWKPHYDEWLAIFLSFFLTTLTKPLWCLRSTDALAALCKPLLSDARISTRIETGWMPHDSRLSGKVLGKQEETAKQPEILSSNWSNKSLSNKNEISIWTGRRHSRKSRRDKTNIFWYTSTQTQTLKNQYQKLSAY